MVSYMSNVYVMNSLYFPRLGYRGLDTASVYSNEKECGKALTDSGIPRHKLYIQTKLWRSFTGKGTVTLGLNV